MSLLRWPEVALCCAGPNNGSTCNDEITLLGRTPRKATIAEKLYPMCCPMLSYILHQSRLPSFAQLKCSGQLFEPKDDDIVHFISHQWLGSRHADPDGFHLRKLQYVFSKVIQGRSRALLTDYAWRSLFDHDGKVGERRHRGRHKDFFCRPADGNSFMWLDFCSLPQLCEGGDADDHWKVVNSVPYYVERCDAFWVLAPSVTHAETGLACDFASWRSRGWCRFEEWLAYLSADPKTPLVITDFPKIEAMRVYEASPHMWCRPDKAPCNGELTCCARGHLLPCGDSPCMRETACDKLKFAPVLLKTFRAKMASLESSSDSALGLLILGETLLFGSPAADKEASLGRCATLREFLCFANAGGLETVRGHLRSPVLQVLFAVADPSIVKDAVRAKPDLVREVGVGDWTPLHFASFRMGETLDEILSDNAEFREPSVLDAASQTGARPLHIAAKYGFDRNVEALLHHRADVNCKRSDNGQTALHCAAFTGYASCCRALLRHGAELGARDADGCTSLHLAVGKPALFGNLEVSAKLDVVSVLLEEKADCDARDDFRRTPLSIAQNLGHDALYEKLVDAGSSFLAF